MTITTTRLYQIISDKMGKETAESLTTFIGEKVKEDISSRTEIFLTQKDKVDLIDKINKAEKSGYNNFLILLSTGLTIGGTIIVLAIDILNKFH